jgi:hypothetical protein
MDNGRLDELFDRYLDRELSTLEEAELVHLLARPDCMAHWRRLASLEGKLQEELLESSFGGADKGKVDAPIADDSRSAILRRSLRRSDPRAAVSNAQPYWMAGFVAAVLLFAVLLLASLISSSSDPNPAHKASARRPTLLEPSELKEADGNQVQADAARRDQEARLEEIRRRREELGRLASRQDQDAAEQEKHQSEESQLAKDKERIEREMRDAIERAKTVRGPVPVEQKPSAPPGLPSIPSEVTTQAVVAGVEDVTGEASLVTKEGKVSLKAGANLLSGQGIETGGGKSRIVLRFVDRTQIQFGPNSSAGEIKAEKGKHLFVSQGTVRAVVVKQPKDEPLIFVTPHGEAKVLGTTLRLWVDPDPKKGTRLEVEEGKVELKNLAGKIVDVPAGNSAVAASGLDLVAAKVDSSAQVPRPGLALWLRADQGAVVRGSSVAAWTDHSGNNRHATQPLPACQPALVRGAVNGHPALRFDGVDDSLAFPCPVTGLTEMTIFLVAAALEDRTGGVNGSGNAALFWHEAENYGTVVVSPFQTKIRFFFGTGQRQAIFSYTRPSSLGQGYSLTTAIKNGTSALLFVNGQESLRVTGQVASIAQCDKIGQIGRGEGDVATNRQFPGQFEGWNYFSGEIAEIVVYARALPEAERTSVEQYLLGKYFSK